MGIREILTEWTAYRMGCVKRRLYFDLKGKKDRLHLVKGLEAILLDIDKAVNIVRNTEEEKDVVPNLMIGFGIDETQADYVAEIRLRQLNRNYIIKRIDEKEQLEKDIAELEDILKSNTKIKKVIIKELREVAKKYGQPRKSEILYGITAKEDKEEEPRIPAYPVNVFVTKEGYFKKITPQSLRMSGEHKLKQDDEIAMHIETQNNANLIVFTDKMQAYKSKLREFADTKRSAMGEYLPAKLNFDEGENMLKAIVFTEYTGHILFCFDNGKAAKIPLAAYETKQNRKKLINAYSDKAGIVDILYLPDNRDIAFVSSVNRALVVNTAQIPEKSTKSSIGVQVQVLKKNQTVKSVSPADSLNLENPAKYRTKNIPARGSFLKDEDIAQQLTLE